MSRTTILIILGVVVVAGGIIGYRYFSGTGYIASNPEAKYELATVQRGVISQEISATGKVASPTNIDLQFKNSGKLVRLKAVVGKKVKAGELLAQQDTGILNAQLSEMLAGVDVAKAQLENYQAALNAQRAKLEELKRGTRPEEVRVQETKVENAKTALADAKQNLVNTLQDSYTKSDDAVRSKADQIFENPQSSNPQLKFTIADQQLENDIRWERLLIENTLKTWKASLDQLTTESNLNSYISAAKQNLNKIKSFSDRSALAVSKILSNIAQTTIDKWTTDISTARTNINTAVTNLSTAEEKLRTAISNLTLAENELALKKAGTVTEQIAAQEAQVGQAKANITLQEARIKQTEASTEGVRAQIRELTLSAPVAGVITKVNGEIGETIKSETIVVSMMPSGNLQIDVDISEADVVNVKVGQAVKITLDAFDAIAEWTGKIVKIDPAETVKGGAIYYKTTVFFDKEDERIRSGMTANIWVKTASKENALYIPLGAIKEKRGKEMTDSRLYPYVEVLEGSQVKEKEVQTGIKGNNGMIEIISGLNEGEQVILSTKSK